jgi:hypothetical protein
VPALAPEDGDAEGGAARRLRESPARSGATPRRLSRREGGGVGGSGESAAPLFCGGVGALGWGEARTGQTKTTRGAEEARPPPGAGVTGARRPPARLAPNGTLSSAATRRRGRPEAAAASPAAGRLKTPGRRPLQRPVRRRASKTMSVRSPRRGRAGGSVAHAVARSPGPVRAEGSEMGRAGRPGTQHPRSASDTPYLSLSFSMRNTRSSKSSSG